MAATLLLARAAALRWVWLRSPLPWISGPLLAERAHAHTKLVAAAHSVRLLIVTMSIPFGMQFGGLHGRGLLPAGVREVHAGGLVLLLVEPLYRRTGRAG